MKIRRRKKKKKRKIPSFYQKGASQPMRKKLSWKKN